MAPDGFPMSARVPIEPDEAAGRIRLEGGARSACPLAPERACLTAHEHHPDFKWQVNFQVRGNLLPDDGGWALIPRKLVGGFELPPSLEARPLPPERPQDDALPQDREAPAGRNARR